MPGQHDEKSNVDQTTYSRTQRILTALDGYYNNNYITEKVPASELLKMYQAADPNFKMAELLKKPSFIESTQKHYCYITLPDDNETATILKQLLTTFTEKLQQDVVFVTIDTLKLAIGFKKATIKHGFEIQGPTLVELEKELESENKPGPYHFKLSKEEYDALLSNSKRITYYQAIMDVYTSVMKSGDLIFKVLGEYLNLQINLVPDFLFKSCTSYLRALSNQSWEALTDFISDFDTKLKARIMTKQHYLVQKSNSIHQQIHILRSLHFNISNANMPETTKLVIKLLEKAEAMVKEIDQRMAEAPDNIPACEHYFEHMNKTQAINHSEVTGAAKLLCEKIEKIEDYFKENAAIVSSLQKQYQEKSNVLAAKIASFTDPKQKNAPMSIDSYQALYTGSTELTTKFIDLKIGFEQLKQKAINHQSELRDLQTSLQALMPVNAYAPIGCITNHYEQNLSQDINSFTQNIQTCQEHLNILKWYEFQLRQLQPASENRDAKTIEALIKLKISQNQARDKTTADVEASTNNNTSPN